MGGLRRQIRLAEALDSEDYDLAAELDEEMVQVNRRFHFETFYIKSNTVGVEFLGHDGEVDVSKIGFCSDFVGGV